MPFSGQNMAIFNQKLWYEPSNDMFVWSVLKSNLSEHNFIHFYVLLTCPVMRKGQKWSEKQFSGQHMVIFDQKLWAEPSIDILVSKVLKSNLSELNFIHFYVLLNSLVMKKWMKWSKMPFSGQNMAIFDKIPHISKWFP